jgi:formylglycine-generating enzyme required for sulfatase activity
MIASIGVALVVMILVALLLFGNSGQQPKTVAVAREPKSVVPAKVPLIAKAEPAKPIPVTVAESVKPVPLTVVFKELPFSATIKLNSAWVPSGDSWLGGGGGREGARPFKLEKGFWCGQFEVTQQQWMAVMGKNPSQFQGRPMNPVEMVSWDQVQGFIKKLNANNVKNGIEYRLPTADEWEYIVRGGPISRMQSQYSYYFSRSKTDFTAVGSNNLTVEQANWYGNGTSAVGKYIPNPLGIYDMHGNVWEWTTTLSGADRVFCGGCYSDSDVRCSAAIRMWSPTNYSSSNIGFRLIGIQLHN